MITDILGKDTAHAIVIQFDGKIVVAGTSDGNFALARYNANGTLDTSIGNNGRVVTDFGGSNVAYTVAIQPDGKIVVAGYAFITANGDFAVVRYWP